MRFALPGILGFALLVVPARGTNGVAAEADDVPLGMVDKEIKHAIEKGLLFLAGTQRRDGAWRTHGRSGSYPCAMTSLAGLAMLAGGHTPIEGRYAYNVRRAVDYVLNCASPNGLIARTDEEMRPMYGHGFGMLFLAQAHGMERDSSKQNRIRAVLERAVRLTGQSQSKAGGWIYTPNATSDEGSVTVTQIQGLRAIRDVGIDVPKNIIDSACEYIQKSANPDGGIRYRIAHTGGSRPAITAAAVATMYSASQYEHPVALKALEFVKERVSTSKTGHLGGGHRYYAMLYTAQAMYLSSEENWHMYFPKVRETVLRGQASDGAWRGKRVGVVYTTAVSLLVLQLPYGYLPALQR